MTPFERDLVAQRPFLLRFAMRLTGNRDHAEDLVQTAIMKALAARDSFATDTDLRAWISTILRNEFYTTWRKRRHEVADPEGLIVSQVADDSSPDFEVRDKYRRLMARLDRLDPFDKALLLEQAEGVDYETLAVKYRIAVGTVKSRLSRLRERLVPGDFLT